MKGGIQLDVQLKRGLLEVCVLAAIRKEDSYGYQIIRDMKPYIEMSESTLYPILRRLETAQLLTVRSAEHNGRLRKYYRITGHGEARIQEFMKDWDELLSVYRYISGGAIQNCEGGSGDDEAGIPERALEQADRVTSGGC
jgi:PadR family transcriptional regulator PadR